MLFYLVILCSVLSLSTADTCSVDNSKKVDCGFDGVTQATCEAKNCCWQWVDDYTTPWCYTKALSTSGYQLTNVKEVSTGLKGTLELIGDASSTYGDDISTLTLEIFLEDADYARVKITDAAESRWEIPQSLVSRPEAVPKVTTMNYEVTYTSNPFTISVTRLSDSVVVFNSAMELYYKDQYIEFTHNYDSSATTFGLGESTRLNHALTTDDTIYTLWAGDTPALLRDINLYSSFPMYLQMLNGQASGGMMMNSNGMDVVLSKDKLTYKMIGGVVDFYVFIGPTPADVVSQYTSVVGRPTMMPYWSLGFHNCKYGYTSISQVEDVVANYSAAGIPLDTQWVDIDYMQNYRDFTTDADNFPMTEMKSFVDSLHENGQHFVPIVDPGIMVYDDYPAYTDGMKEDIFVKDINGDPYLGQVWPGPTYFPDFTHPKATSYWTEQLQSFYDQLPIDGIWIDMNEVSNFCNDDGRGQVCANTAASGCPAPGASQTDCCLECTEVDSTNKFDYPPYSIHNNKGKLSVKTAAVSATQYGNVSMYNTHNMYGLSEQLSTNAAMSTIRGKRPFLLTRSAFLSTGVHSAKWTGDNEANWNDLKSSIVSIMDFSLFGIPMIGADICGFISDTTEELCARWIEVGAFYPFSRNHNALGQKPQELYLWDSVTEASKKYLNMRYTLLPYMYTLHYGAHSTGKVTVATALWMNFPEDAQTLSINYQFMLGSGLMISPVVEEGATSVNAYFPAGYWYNFETLELEYDTTSAGKFINIDTPLTSTNVHVVGGTILPLQQSAMTTTLSRQTPFTLVVALCPGGKAYGSLYWDAGEDITVADSLSVDFVAETGDSNYVSGVVSKMGDISDFTSLSITTVVVTGAADQIPATVSHLHATSAGEKINVVAKRVASNGDMGATLTIATDLPITSDFKITWE